MYYRRRHLGCCSTGPAVFGQDEAGAAPSGGELLPVAGTVAVVPPNSSGHYPWGTLFAVSVAAGLTLHILTRRRG
jgi:hypothetical protein